LNHRDTPTKNEETFAGGMPDALKPWSSLLYPPVKYILRNWYWTRAFHCSLLFHEASPELTVLLLALPTPAEAVKRRMGEDEREKE